MRARTSSGAHCELPVPWNEEDGYDCDPGREARQHRPYPASLFFASSQAYGGARQRAACRSLPRGGRVLVCIRRARESTRLGFPALTLRTTPVLE